MSKIFNKNYKGIFSKQNRALPIIFWFLPLIIINIGWYFKNLIVDYRWEQSERKEKAKQEVEKLAVMSDFSYCFGKLGRDFYQSLKKGSENYSNKNKDLLKKYIENQDKDIFRKPFPEYELFVFNISNNTKKTEIIYSNQINIIGKRALELIFEFLVKVNSPDNSYSETNKKKASDFAKSILGGECDPTIIAETQRGKASFSLYKFKQNRFYWDYYTNPNTGDIIGFLLIADNDTNAEISGKLIALRDFHKNQKTKNNIYGAFIPLFPGYGGIIADEEFSKLPEYQLMKSKWRPKDIDDLYTWNKNGVPSDKEDIIIGNYQAFFHIAQGQSHCAVLLIPSETEKKLPNWLLLINIIFSSFIILLLLRGLILGIWPTTSLRARFFTTYFLASSIPLGLLIVVSNGYISEYKHSTLFKYQSQLKLSINQFDIRQTKSQQDYQAALMNLKNDKEISLAFKNLDIANKEKPEIFLPEAEEVLSRSVKHFYKTNKNLPILSMTIIDERGGCFTNLGNNELMYYRYKENENEKGVYFGKNKDELDLNAINDSLIEKTIDTILYSILQPLRKRISILEPSEKKWDGEFKPSFEQKIAVGGFNAALGNSAGSLSEEFDRRKGIIVTRKNGNKIISYLYDYIIVGKAPRFAIFIYWDVGSLDELTIKSTLDSLAIQEPNHSFSAVKVTPQGIKEWKKSRHWSYFETTKNLVNQAFLSKTAVTYRDENKTIIAVPSKKYQDTVIIGAVSHHHMDLPIFYRLLLCIAVIAISIMIFIVCLVISLRLFINPIDKVKKALDKIALGEFDLEIKSGRKDEFGTICKEFTNMTQELSERNKLATLISDHAIEALNRKEGTDDLANVESFIGTTLVSDIRNFTGMCEHYPPDQITELLNEHFAVMTKIISENGGRIYKYIGDAIEVVFANQDDSQKTSVERAFQASIEMIEGLREINQKRLEKGLFEYKIGIGLGYGEMLSGSIGNLETRLDYAIIGKALENATKTESLSKFNQKLPIVFAKEFVDEFQKQYSKIEFTPFKNDNDLKTYIIEKDNIDNYIEEKGKNTIKSEISEVLNIANKTNKTTEKTTKIIETERKYSNIFYFTNALVFLILFTLVVFGGLYFSYSSELTNKKTLLSYDNQRVLEQLSCEEYGKIAFDTKCREMAKILNDKINEFEDNNITDKFIENTLNEIYKSDKIFKNVGFSKLFIRAKNIKESIDTNNDAFYDNFSIEPLANTGFTPQEETNICNAYRICITLNSLSEITKISKRSEKDENKFQLKVRRNLERDYGEPSRQVFGENALIALLRNDWINTSVEVTRLNKITNVSENHYLYTLDYYKINKYKPDSNPELIGYLVISLPKDKALNSIPLFLNAYSQDNGFIALKRTDETDGTHWSFSDNITDEIRNNIINKNIIQDYMEKEADKNIVDQYFNSLNDTNIKDNINIGENNFDIYISKLYKTFDKTTFLVFFSICLLFIFLYSYFIRIIKGNTIVNYSISAKLWLNLVIVAIIPLLTMIFTFNHYVNEHLSVQKSLEKNKMQKFNDNFELKPSFSEPIAWTLSKKKSNSEELLAYIKALNSKNQTKEYYNNYLEKLRTLTESWLAESKTYTQKEKDIISFFIADMSISGKNGWSFCVTDKEDKYQDNKLDLSVIANDNPDDALESVSYIESNIDNSRKGFGLMLKLFAKALLNTRGEGMNLSNSEIDNSAVFNDLAVDTALKTVKTFFGDDKFVEFSHGIQTPILMDIGVGNLGVMIIPIPDYKKPEAILVWMIMFNTYIYLNEQASKINTDFKVYSAEGFRYGIIAKDTYDNDLRIPIGKYAAWVSTSNLPISTNIDIKNEQYLMEGISAKFHFNTLMFYLYPEKLFFKDINNLYLKFYTILIISIILIIDTTRNIAYDIINPISALITGIKEVNRENFGFRINTDRTDELGALCQSFDKMVKGLDEKRTMSHMLSKSAQLFTLKDNEANSIKIDSVLLYVGIPNFNTYTKELSNEKVFSYLNKHTSIIAGIIMKEGGEVDKIIGEKLLAVFPVNTNVNESLTAAYNVARKIQEEEKANKLPLPVAIGLNYGNVISGFLGVGNKRDFTIIGDSVNVTARIESLAEKLDKDRCLISATFYEHIKDHIKAKLYGEVELKGKSQPMKVYRLF